jgi:hypothetical protein
MSVILITAANLVSLLVAAAPNGIREPLEAAGRKVCLGKTGNPELRGLKLGQQLTSLQGDYDDGFVQFASSFLQPSTKPPKKSDFYPDPCALPGASECDRADVRFGVAFFAWSCMHSPEALWAPVGRLDLRPASTWAEGVDGTGLGETIVFGLASDRMVIWSGHSKSQTSHDANSRPKRVRVMVLQGQAYSQNGNFGAQDILVIAQHFVELKDVFGYQPLPLPAYRKSNVYTLQRRRYVALEILSVYPGTRWEDTCVSHAFGLNSSSTVFPESAFSGGADEAVYVSEPN